MLVFYVAGARFSLAHKHKPSYHNNWKKKEKKVGWIFDVKIFHFWIVYPCWLHYKVSVICCCQWNLRRFSRFSFVSSKIDFPSPLESHFPLFPCFSVHYAVFLTLTIHIIYAHHSIGSHDTDHRLKWRDFVWRESETKQFPWLTYIFFPVC